jgi:hypothetical protein
MPRKKKNSNLPPPKYADGGNRYIGKCKENSEVFCLFHSEFGCICVQPAETEEQLKVKLQTYIENGKKNLSLNNDLGRWDYYKENIPIWEARLAKL